MTPNDLSSSPQLDPQEYEDLFGQYGSDSDNDQENVIQDNNHDTINNSSKNVKLLFPPRKILPPPLLLPKKLKDNLISNQSTSNYSPSPSIENENGNENGNGNGNENDNSLNSLNSSNSFSFQPPNPFNTFIKTSPKKVLEKLSKQKSNLQSIKQILNSYLTQLQIEERIFVGLLKILEISSSRPIYSTYPDIGDIDTYIPPSTYFSEKTLEEMLNSNIGIDDIPLDPDFIMSVMDEIDQESGITSTFPSNEQSPKYDTNTIQLDQDDDDHEFLLRLVQKLNG